ncbi:helix-turn-helix transcriptional regulator [Vagococcus lutrae]|uniref:helix-turn-helix transcriptional regulator n=1 Tax=Vagococcus lutrae TaxID=81947 RepID=UPI001C98DBD4|nr:helix-turn-helix transcriptional regulator [Vagococcus lutrae]QZN88052.1 helix-turn-helix transcriptional regulator [Vagococcus lutrae]
MNPENLQKTVINNLFEVLKHYGLSNNRKKIADFLNVNYSTFRAWISYNRTPSLETLDKISNTLSIPTHILFIPDLQTEDVKRYIDNEIQNNSSFFLDKNLKSVYRDQDLNNWRAVENIYGSLLSQESLKSYHRKNNSRIPTINTLEKMSTYLGVPAYKLIMGGKHHEYKS